MQRGEQPIVYGDGTQTRDFTNVQDVVQGITRAMETEKKLGNQIFNIGTGKSTTLLQIITVINAILGTSIAPKHIENPVRESYIQSQLADISKITSMLGYQPSVTLEEGIRDIVTKLPTKASVRDRRAQANSIPVK
jgi:UDP-glucose 4-epimerase